MDIRISILLYQQRQQSLALFSYKRCWCRQPGRAIIKSDIPFRYFTNSEYGFIGDVFTETSHRNCSISMQLYRHALEWLKDYGVDFVRLLASDAGRSNYERLGFSADDSLVLKIEA